MGRRFQVAANFLKALQNEDAEGFRAQSLGMREQAIQQRGEQQDQSLAIREQEMGFREEHLKGMQEVAEQAARAHDAETTAKIAQQSAATAQKQVEAERKALMFNQEKGAWNELRSLSPQSPDYLSKRAEVGMKYPAAFSKTQGDEENGLSKFVSSLDQEHQAYSKMTMETENAKATLAAQKAEAAAANLTTSRVGVSATGSPEQTFTKAPDALPKDLRDQYETLKVTQAQRGIYLDKETDPEKKKALQADIDGGNIQQQAFEKTYPSLTQAPAASPQPSASAPATPAQPSMRYNPDSGKLEPVQ